MSPDPEARWLDVSLALACFALDPGALGGLWLRARVGPVRDRVEAALTTALTPAVLRRISPTIPDDALFGGVDLAATLESGTLHRITGILAQPGVLILPMAERTEPHLAARLSTALDTRRDVSLVALDEGAEADEQLPAALRDRLALHLDLTDLAPSDAPAFDIPQDDLADARALLPKVAVPDDVLAQIVEVAAGLGVGSLRAPLQALAVARASAALSGSTQVEEPDLLMAVQLVLAPRATQIPSAEADTPPPPPPSDDAPEPDDTDTDTAANDALPPVDMLLAAAKAMLPPDLLARMAAGTARTAGSNSGTGAKKTGNRRGRPLSPRPGRLDRGARIDLVATLRAAAPWQTIRRAANGDATRIHVRSSDLRIRRFQEKSDRAIIFVVDASGSAAMARLAEAKGAVELLLAEAYARRDHVALVAFRGDTSDILLPPTRSLVQTKRRLASLPGGGGTPLAAGLKAAMELAALAQGKGMTPSIALLTDGRANVDLSGAANRAQAAEDASHLARVLRGRQVSGLVIDTGARPTRALDALAQDMGAPYLALPRADSRSLSRAVDAALAP